LLFYNEGRLVEAEQFELMAVGNPNNTADGVTFATVVFQADLANLLEIAKH
jgi:hypothetical protein